MKAENTAKMIATTKGAAIGGAAGGAVVAAAAANVAAAGAATATSASLASTFVAFGMQATVTNPATWALLATNPLGLTLLVAGGVTVGAVGFCKLAKLVLD